MAGSTSKDEDEMPTNFFKEKIAFNILYDTVNGVKTNPHLDKPGFSMGGLDFLFSAEPIDHNVFKHALFLDLSETSKRSLAYGYEIALRCSMWTYFDEGGQQHDLVGKAFFPLHEKKWLFHFTKRIVRYEADLELKYQDVFPHRLQFVDAEVAKETMNDCKIVLVDDENKIVYVNKHILASRSLFFKLFFFGDFIEKDRDEIKLKHVKEEDFLEYLYSAYPAPNRPFAFKRIEALLCMVDRFQNDLLMAEIEKFLMATEKKTSKEKQKILLWSDACNMKKLFRDTLKTMSEAELKKIGTETCMRFKKENLELVVARFMGEL